MISVRKHPGNKSKVELNNVYSAFKHIKSFRESLKFQEIIITISYSGVNKITF